VEHCQRIDLGLVMIGLIEAVAGIGGATPKFLGGPNLLLTNFTELQLTYRRIIRWTKCIVAHPTKILGGPWLTRPLTWLTQLERCLLFQSRSSTDIRVTSYMRQSYINAGRMTMTTASSI